MPHSAREDGLRQACAQASLRATAVGEDFERASREAERERAELRTARAAILRGELVPGLTVIDGRILDNHESPAEPGAHVPRPGLCPPAL